MKKLITLILLAFCCMAGYAQAFIDPLLSEEMAQRNDEEQIKVIVIMKARYDRNEMWRRADYYVNRAQRREFVVNELKSFAAASQYELIRNLKEMERQGMVSEPVVLWMANALYFDATKAAILDLARRNDIAMIGFAKEYNWIPDGEEATPASATREITQNVIQVGANQVWALGYTGAGVVVAVIDTGVNYNHVDVADHLWDGGSEFPHHGYDVKNHDNDPMDDHGHGSHCSGTVCGDGTAGSQTGMAPNATLMCVKCLDATGNGGAQSISEGIQWAVEHGCDLFSMSLGLPNSSIPDRTLLRHTCEAALDAGVVAAIAAGNEGSQTWQYPIPNNVRVPGSCPPPYMDEVQGQNPGGQTCSVCIGAVDYNDNAAYFTSRGPVTWQNTEFADYAYNPGIGLIRPDVCAPGVDIKSLNYQTNTGYTSMSGTSMATPCVAGCMALMLCKDINLTPSEVCRILEETAVPLAQGKSNTYGFGRVNVFEAVEAIQIGAIKYNDYALNDPLGNNNHRLNPGESVTLSLTLDNITDELVNDVTVALATTHNEVTITDGTVEFPNFAANETITVEDAFAFTVTENVSTNENIRFTIAVSIDGEVAGTFGFLVPVSDYTLQYATTIVLNDDNGNGLLEPGETADLRIFIDNEGNEIAQNMVGVLSSEYDYLTLNETEESFGTVGIGLMAYADYSVTLDAAAPANFEIPFTLSLTDMYDRTTALDFDYKNVCSITFTLHDSNDNGWQGNYLQVAYEDGQPLEQMTISDGSSATYIRYVAAGYRIRMTWHNGQNTQQCSFEVTYEDGTVIFENQGGFTGNKVFTINCATGSGMTGFCDPAQNLTYELNGHDVVLSWEAPESGTPIWYEIYRETELIELTDELTFTDPDLEEGLYNYCVYAAYDDCQSEFVCIEADVSNCGGVRDLEYTLDDELLLTLTWDAPEDPTGLVEYQVYMDDEQLTATNELIYAFTVTEGQHDIVVKAVFAGCDKDTHVAVCIVGAVQNLTYQMESHNAILNWEAIEGVSQYEVYANGALVATVETTAYAFDIESGLTTFTVKAVAEGCYVLGASVEVCFTEPVSDLSFIVMDYSGMHFVWSNVADVEYYEVVYNDNTVQLPPESSGATGFSFDPIVGENTICVTVHSVYGCDSEPACMTKEVCAAVDGFDYTFVGNEVTVTWNDVADSYFLQINGTEYVTVETNAYTATVDNGLDLQVTPIYEDCFALSAVFYCEVTNIAPEIRIRDVHEGLMATVWTEVEDAIAYNLYRDGELIAERLTETSYNDTEMVIDMQHCYTVQSVFEKGVSDLSEAACANYFTGMDENEGTVAIFPNPTTDKVTIQCEGMTLVEVWSAEGKLVQRIKVDGDAYQLDGLENGIYMLRIQKGENTLIRRVVKM